MIHRRIVTDLVCGPQGDQAGRTGSDAARFRCRARIAGRRSAGLSIWCRPVPTSSQSLAPEALRHVGTGGVAGPRGLDVGGINLHSQPKAILALLGQKGRALAPRESRADDRRHGPMAEDCGKVLRPERGDKGWPRPSAEARATGIGARAQSRAMPTHAARARMRGAAASGCGPPATGQGASTARAGRP